MTAITQEQFEAAKGAAQSAISGQRCALTAALTTLGITITPAEPPEAMVKLACVICQDMATGLDPDEYALAALQHAVKKARRMRDQRIESAAAVEVCDEILTALGAGGRDAG